MENFDISRFFKVLANSKLYICFILLLFIAVGYFYSFYYVTPMYKSTATVVLVQNDNFENKKMSSSITQSDITLNQNLLSTYTNIAKSPKVLEQVINNLNLDISASELASLVSVNPVSSTEVFKISVSNKDNTLAASITNELLNVFSHEVKSLYNMNNVYIMDMAEVSNSPYNINHVKDLVIFGMIGFVISFGLVVVIYLFDTTIKSEQDIEEYAGLAVLSTIPVYQDKQNKNFNELIVNEQPKAPISECFKTFRTNIMFSIQNKKLNTILVTSGFMGEGKSFVASNLAVTFAKSGKKVILVDTDMRKGRLHKIFGLEHRPGLSNCLSDIGSNGSLVNINEYIQKTGIPNLHVMTSGNVPPNPSELLSSTNMKKFLEALNTQYDVVICDGTPCMLVSDSVILSKIVDTTVIVTANKVTKLDTLLKIKKSIENVGGNIGGVVINKMNMNAKTYQNKYYYGNHNEVNEKLEFIDNSSDAILNNVLCISDTDANTFDVAEEGDLVVDVASVEGNDNLDKISNMISDNTKEILELKGIYKNSMQNTLNALLKKDSSASIIDELNGIKASYEDAINSQNEYIATLDNKISNFKVEDNSSVILDELNSIKASYEDAINSQNEYIATLDNKISNFKVEDNSSVILDELNSIKASYDDAINSQNEYIATLDNKISNFKVEDNSEIILNELNSIKASYKDAINAQNEYIATLDNKISNFKVEDNSEIILNELNSIKASYKNAINAQNEYIATLDNKISNFKVEDNSSVILDELNSIKSSYEDAFNAQNEYIATLDNKISNFKVEDNSEIILDELNSIKTSYEDAINSQNEYIATLDDKISNFKVEDNSEIILDELNSIKTSYDSAINSQNSEIKNLNDKVDNIHIPNNTELLDAVANIYKQLESFNLRFDALEKKALHNEELIKNISKSNVASYKNNKIIDIKKLDDNVIKIQDYLEDGYNIALHEKNSTKKSKNVLDGQINIIDALLENTNKQFTTNTTSTYTATNNNDNVANNTTTNSAIDLDKKDFIIDYEKIKNKQKKGLFGFKSSRKEPDYEEPIEIVSQILCGDKKEYVG